MKGGARSCVGALPLQEGGAQVAVARRGDIGSVPLVLRTALRVLGTHQWVPCMALLVGISTSSCGVLHGVSVASSHGRTHEA